MFCEVLLTVPDQPRADLILSIRFSKAFTACSISTLLCLNLAVDNGVSPVYPHTPGQYGSCGGMSTISIQGAK